MLEETTDNATDNAQDNTNADQTTEQQAPATEEPKDKGFADDESADTKPAEGFEDTKEDADKESEEEDKPDEGAPESYEPFKVEEGFDITDDEFKAVTEISKEFNLSQEQAQKMIDLKFSIDKARDESTAKAQKDEILSWQKETRKGLGDKYDAEIAIGKRAHKTFMPEAFQKFLAETGLVHHPDYIRGMIKVGKAISEDTFVKGNEQKGSEEVFNDLTDIFEQPPVEGAK